MVDRVVPRLGGGCRRAVAHPAWPHAPGQEPALISSKRAGRHAPMTLFSVLDQGPVRRDAGPAQSVRNAVALARDVDAFGYARYWVAEHHSTTSRAIAAPEVLI